MDRQLAFTYVLGVAVVVGYVALGVWAVRTAWAWSTPLRAVWARAAIVSTLITVFFAPGLGGAGHGVVPVPVWIMFTTGTFGALTTESQRFMLLGLVVFWLVVFAVVWAVISRRRHM